MFQGYHTLVPGINSHFVQTVWVPNVMSWNKTSHMMQNIEGQKFEFYLKMLNYISYMPR